MGRRHPVPPVVQRKRKDRHRQHLQAHSAPPPGRTRSMWALTSKVS